MGGEKKTILRIITAKKDAIIIKQIVNKSTTKKKTTIKKGAKGKGRKTSNS